MRYYSCVKRAIATYNQQLALWQTLGDRTREAETLYNIAVTECDRDNFNAALTQIEVTIQTEPQKFKICCAVICGCSRCGR
ncbi:hypothetical protein [Nostoc sp.]|uniref:hypothetical protein n=1 Tax=Nostoc sp. TaxID=1180 RepID=UPI002FF5C6AA